jgi:hypothetical protein
MRNFPREIEADLLFRGVDIHDWHRGKMSSRRLLALIDALPDDSAYWRERRDGDWSEKEYLDGILVNEIRLLRADQAAIAGTEMKVNLVKSPAEREEKKAEEDKFHAARAHILGALKGKPSPPPSSGPQ